MFSNLFVILSLVFPFFLFSHFSLLQIFHVVFSFLLSFFSIQFLFIFVSFVFFFFIFFFSFICFFFNFQIFHVFLPFSLTFFFFFFVVVIFHVLHLSDYAFFTFISLVPTPPCFTMLWDAWVGGMSAPPSCVQLNATLTRRTPLGP